MNYMYLAFGLGILLIILFWIMMRELKKLKKAREEIPEEVINEFNKAEEMLRRNQGRITSQEVLWNLYKNRGNIPEEEMQRSYKYPNPFSDRETDEEIEEPKPKARINLRELFKKKNYR